MCFADGEGFVEIIFIILNDSLLMCKCSLKRAFDTGFGIHAPSCGLISYLENLKNGRFESCLGKDQKDCQGKDLLRENSKIYCLRFVGAVAVFLSFVLA